MHEPITTILDKDYKNWLTQIKTDYRRSQIKAAVKVNEELLRFYWRLGRGITLIGGEAKWGTGFFEALSKDLKKVLPESKGFSSSNLRYMEKYYGLFPDSILPQVVEEIRNDPIRFEMNAKTGFWDKPNEMPLKGAEIFQVPWGHIRLIIDKCGTNQEKALFYIKNAIKNNWSRAVLLTFLGTDLYERSNGGINNFDLSLPKEDGDLAKQMIKDPFRFDFLMLREEYDEKELKDALIGNIERFLLELGQGFAYLGKEYRLLLGEEEEFCDMLFYNTNAHAYVVIEVKTEKFKPADIGQLGTYVVAVDHTLKSSEDNKTIGLLICKDKSEVTARYALESSAQPMGISSFELSKLIPKDFQGSLPTIEEIENRIAGGNANNPTINKRPFEVIKSRREAMGMTQRQLAELCGTPQSTIARFESGESYLNLRTFEKICSALGLRMRIEG